MEDKEYTPNLESQVPNLSEQIVSTIDAFEVGKLMDEKYDMAGDNVLYRALLDAVSKGNNTLAQNAFMQSFSIDADWIEAIQDGLLSIEKIAKRPKNTIRDERELVNIEKAKRVDGVAVRHLSTHTQYIRQIRDDGSVLPSSVMTRTFEEEVAIYENRFVYALLQRLKVFVERRYETIIEQSKIKNNTSLSYHSTFKFGEADVNYKLQMAIKTPSGDEAISKVNDDLIDKLELIRQKIRVLDSTEFARIMRKAKPVYPPIQRTNILVGNTDYTNCYHLWLMLSSYNTVGYSVNVVDTPLPFDDGYFNDLTKLVAASVEVMTANDEIRKAIYAQAKPRRITKKRYKITPHTKLTIDKPGLNRSVSAADVNEFYRERIRKMITELEDLSDAFNDEEETGVPQEVNLRSLYRRVTNINNAMYDDVLHVNFEDDVLYENELDELEAQIRHQKKVVSSYAQLRRLKEEEAGLALKREEAQRKKLERLKAKLNKVKKQEEERRKAEEKRLELERIREEKRLEAERQKEERERLAAEKQAERERIAAEKQAERERIAAEKQAERERIAAEKQAERERLAAEKQAERERIAAEKQAERERIAAEKQAEEERLAAEKAAKEEAERKAKEEAERKAKEEAERKAKEEAERKAQEEAERKAQEEAERKAKEEAERKAKEEERKAEAERKAAEEAARKAREEAERKAKESEPEPAEEGQAGDTYGRLIKKRRFVLRRKAIEIEKEKALQKGARAVITDNQEAARKAAEEAERKAREEAERKAAEEAERKAAEEAERKAAEEAERKAQEEAERKAQEEAERKAKEEAERKAKEEAERKAAEEAERKAREEAERKAREEAERKAAEEAERKAREEAQRKAAEEAERKAREEAERKAREEAERKAREEAERKAQEEAERKAREEAERKAREEAERKAHEEAERKAREEAERKAREEAERKAAEEAERKAREEAERKAREEAERKAREEAERKTLAAKAKEEFEKRRKEVQEKKEQIEAKIEEKKEQIAAAVEEKAAQAAKAADELLTRLNMKKTRSVLRRKAIEIEQEKAVIAERRRLNAEVAESLERKSKNGKKKR